MTQGFNSQEKWIILAQFKTVHSNRLYFESNLVLRYFIKMNCVILYFWSKFWDDRRFYAVSTEPCVTLIKNRVIVLIWGQDSIRLSVWFRRLCSCSESRLAAPRSSGFGLGTEARGYRWSYVWCSWRSRAVPQRGPWQLTSLARRLPVPGRDSDDDGNRTGHPGVSQTDSLSHFQPPRPAVSPLLLLLHCHHLKQAHGTREPRSGLYCKTRLTFYGRTEQGFNSQNFVWPQYQWNHDDINKIL